MAETTDVTALALVQPLHGFTFALLHLACMPSIVRSKLPSSTGEVAKTKSCLPIERVIDPEP